MRQTGECFVQNREFQLFLSGCEQMYKQAGHGLHSPSDFFAELRVYPGCGNENSLVFRQP